MMFPACAGMNRVVGRKRKGVTMFPASAGMNRFWIYLAELAVYVPRVRGDEPEEMREGHHAVECSPRPRG